jgi:hypothetical protein
MNDEETRLETAIQAEDAFGRERLQLGEKFPLKPIPTKWTWHKQILAVLT